MRVYGSKELTADVLGGDLCIGCGACVELCPYFRNHRGRTVQLFKCDIEQGRCYAACPKAEVNLDELSRLYWNETYQGAPIGKYEKALASRASDKMPAGPFQGGGTVSALLFQAMNQGLIEKAVLTGQYQGSPRPVIAASPGEILSCAGSKFGAAPTLAAMNRAVAEGYRNLGLVGTPCQVTAIAKVRSNPMELDDFEDAASLVIGLFCNWALDQMALRAFLTSRLDISRVKSMDIPPPPANTLVVELDGEAIEFSLDEIRSFIPESCGFCPDMTSEWADLSVGMFEGRPGWNTLLVRTERGRELVKSAMVAGFLETQPMPEENLEHLKGAAADKKRRAFRAMDQKGILNSFDEGVRALIRVRQDVANKIMRE